MRSWRCLIRFLFVGLILSPGLLAQQSGSQPTPAIVTGARAVTPLQPLGLQRDPEAVAILTTAIKIAGGAGPLSAVEDYVATGTITYYWGSEGVTGNVTIKGRGTGQYRLDADLPEGERSWIVNQGSGSVKEANGTITPIESDNALNVDSLTFPFAYLVSALQDPNTSITYVALETQNGAQVQHIRMWKVFPAPLNQDPLASRLTMRDFFIDANTFLVDGSQDSLHPKDKSGVSLPHTLQFSDYHAVNGLQIPFLVTESGQGGPTSKVQLNQITFNSALSDGDFEF
jgi:hypothetical protein